jgi:hypothetical protein
MKSFNNVEFRDFFSIPAGLAPVIYMCVAVMISLEVPIERPMKPTSKAAIYV